MSFFCNGKEITMVLEPICRLSPKVVNGHGIDEIVGFEILSSIRGIHGDKEVFFNSMTNEDELSLLQWQLRRFQKLSQQDEYFSGKFVTLNVSHRLLSSKAIALEFIPFVFYFKVFVEVDSLGIDSFKNAPLLKENISLFKRIGIDIWLDDIVEKTNISAIVKPLGCELIKMDKSFFWTVYNGGGRGHLPDSLYMSGVDLLAEGIETKEHATFAAKSNINFGQGYLWPSLIVL